MADETKITYETKSPAVDQLHPEIYERFTADNANEVKTKHNLSVDRVTAMATGYLNILPSQGAVGDILTVRPLTAGVYTNFSNITVTADDFKGNIVELRKNTSGVWQKFLLDLNVGTQLETNTDAIAAHETRIDSLEAISGSHGAEIAANSASIASIDSELATVAAIAETAVTPGELTTALNPVNIALGSHGSRLDTIDGEITASNAAIVEHGNRLDLLDVSRAEHGVRLDDLDDEMAAVTTTANAAVTHTQLDTAINALINGAPGALDTLKELADAMGDDPNFATTITNALANKVDKVTGKSLISDAEITRLATVFNFDPSDVSIALGNISTITGGGNTTSTTLSATYNFVHDTSFLAAKKTVKRLVFPYPNTTPFSIFIFSKSGSVFTVIDKILVTPIAGTNSVAIGKTYQDNAYVGFSKGSTMYYTASSVPGERIVRLGTSTLDIGSSLVEDGGVGGKINFTAEYVNSLVDVNALKTSSDANTTAVSNLNTRITPLENSIFKALSVSAGGASTSTVSLSSLYNFVTTEVMIPANKTFKDVVMRYPNATPFSIIVCSKSGADYTVLDRILVTPVAGSNTFPINRTYGADVYIGTAKGALTYYTAGSGRIVRLGTSTLAVGNVVQEDGGAPGLMSFTVSYYNGIVDVNALNDTVSGLVPAPTQEIITPLKIWLLAGEILPFYKTSIIRTTKELVNEFVVMNFPDSDTDFNFPTIESFVNNYNLDSSKLKARIRIISKNYSITTSDYAVGLDIIKSTVTAKTGQSRNIWVWGDSLTNRGVLDYTIKYLAAIGSGLTLLPFGTMTNTTRKGEGREGWTWLNFIGADNTHLGDGTVITRLADGTTTSTLYQNPFLRLATSSDYTSHPTWCFRNTGSNAELSYSTDSDKTGNFYIFDPLYYSAQHLSANVPDIITIALSTNDITENGAAGVTNSLFGLEVVVTQLKVSYPSLKIVIIPATGQGDASPNWSNICDWIAGVNLKLEALAYTNVEVLGIWIHLNKHYMFPYSTSGLVYTNGNKTSKLNKTEIIHFNNVGYIPYAKALGACLINIA